MSMIRGGVLRINKPDSKIIYPQNFGYEEFKDFINNMQAGSCYHFRVNPQWYDRDLNYYGKLKENQMDDQDKVNILTEPTKYDKKIRKSHRATRILLGRYRKVGDIITMRHFGYSSRYCCHL